MVCFFLGGGNDIPPPRYILWGLRISNQLKGGGFRGVVLPGHIGYEYNSNGRMNMKITVSGNELDCSALVNI